MRAAVGRATADLRASLGEGADIEVVCFDGIDYLAAEHVVASGLARPAPGGMRWLADQGAAPSTSIRDGFHPLPPRPGSAGSDRAWGADRERQGPLKGASPRPVAMLTHSYYEEDPRVRREAEALVSSGRPVHVFALRKPSDGPLAELDGVQIRRVDVQRHQGAGLRTYVSEYLSFLLRAGLALSRAHRRQPYGLVQVHTLPDFLVFAAIPVRLAGAPVLLDLHEAMPEFFAMRFPRSSGRLTGALLRTQERLSIAMASHVLTVNDALAERLVSQGVPAEKVSVVAPETVTPPSKPMPFVEV